MSDLTCVVVDGDGTYSGAQGFDYFEASPRNPRARADCACTAWRSLRAAARARVFAVLARTDPNEQESVVLLDENGRRLNSG